MRAFYRTTWTVVLLVSSTVHAEHTVAITIDDLPRGGDRGPRTLPAVIEMTEQLMAPFTAENVPVIGFVNEGRQVEFGADGLRQVLDVWLDAGASLGNHSYSHLNINQVPLADYTADITRGEPITRSALGASPGRVMRQALRQVFSLGLAGLIVGVPTAIVAANSVERFLWGVQPYEPGILVAAAAAVLVAVAVAGFAPARRAALTDPMVALRSE